MYKIDKSVPLPPGRNKYPFGNMEPTNSFVVHVLEGEDVDIVHQRLLSAVGQYRRRHGKGWTFTVRKDGKESVRCWRVT